jgi:hypothetical protein
MLQRRLTVLALLLIALACVAPAHAQPLDLAGYVRLLREAYAAAERGDRIGLEQAAPALIAAERVALPAGGSAPADNAWLAQALGGPNPDMPAIAARLGGLIDALSAPAVEPPADAEQRLRDILARPPFDQPQAAPREPSWLDRLLEWLIQQLGRTFAPVNRAAGSNGGWLSWAIAGVGAALIVAVLWIWLGGLRRSLAPRARAHSANPADDELGASEAALRAAALAHAGDYRSAARLLYLSSLLWLDERGRLRYERALTNREYLDRLADRPALRARLRPVVETFDRVWYGKAPLDAEGFASYERAVAALREDEPR